MAEKVPADGEIVPSAEEPATKRPRTAQPSSLADTPVNIMKLKNNSSKRVGVALTEEVQSLRLVEGEKVKFTGTRSQLLNLAAGEEADAVLTTDICLTSIFVPSAHGFAFFEFNRRRSSSSRLEITEQQTEAPLFLLPHEHLGFGVSKHIMPEPSHLDPGAVPAILPLSQSVSFVRQRPPVANSPVIAAQRAFLAGNRPVDEYVLLQISRPRGLQLKFSDMLILGRGLDHAALWGLPKDKPPPGAWRCVVWGGGAASAPSGRTRQIVARMTKDKLKEGGPSR
jgi:hypothetical protein